jgi:hypothetical protein
VSSNAPWKQYKILVLEKRFFSIQCKCPAIENGNLYIFFK